MKRTKRPAGFISAQIMFHTNIPPSLYSLFGFFFPLKEKENEKVEQN